MPNEADTCRKFVVPRLQSAGWDTDPRRLNEQVTFTDREKGDWKREKVGFRLTELNVADMRNVPVPVPPPAEQRRIVDHVETVRPKVDMMKHLQARTAAELDALLPAVLDRACRGEL
jgi:hypothetical protein